MCPKNVEEAGESFRILKATKTNDHHVYFLVYHPGYGQFIQKLESVEFNIQVPKYLPKITTDYAKKFENSFLNSDWDHRNLWLGQVEGNDSISIIWVC